MPNETDETSNSPSSANGIGTKKRAATTYTKKESRIKKKKSKTDNEDLFDKEEQIKFY